MSFYTLINALEQFDSSSLDGTTRGTELARLAAFQDLENQKLQAKKASKIRQAQSQGAIGSHRKFTNLLGL